MISIMLKLFYGEKTKNYLTSNKESVCTMHTKVKKIILNQLKNVIRLTSSSAVNFGCVFVLGQEKIPDDVKKLRKF